MSEKKIRILPVQADKLTADNNLLDIEIPAGLLVNGVKSYVSLFMKMLFTETNTTAGATNSGGSGIYNLDAIINVGDPSKTTLTEAVSNVKVPTVGLVRNANIISSNKGMIENIRDVNALRLSQYSVEKNYNERTGDAHTSFGACTTQPWGYMSPFIDKGNKDYGITSQNLLKEVRIPLSDIFNICKRQDIPLDTNYLGKTTIHLELDIRRLFADSGYKDPDADPFIKADVGYGSVTDNAVAGDVTSLALNRKYLNNNESECPFYIGQRIVVKSGTLDGVNMAGQIRKVAGLGFGGNVMSLQLDVKLGTNAAAGVVDLIIIPLAPATQSVEIQRTELVICESNASPMNGYNYSTYTLEKDQGGDVTSFNRQYEIEQEAISLLVHTSTKPNGLLSDVRQNSQRVMIDNEQTTNRDVHRHTPLYNNRLIRYYLNEGIPPHSLAQGKSVNQPVASGEGSVKNPNSEMWIYEPLEQTAKMKLVELDMTMDGSRKLNDIKLFKEVVRQI